MSFTFVSQNITRVLYFSITGKSQPVITTAFSQPHEATPRFTRNVEVVLNYTFLECWIGQG
jgi:hypothetical protein